MGKLPIGSVSLAKLSPMRTGLYKCFFFLLRYHGNLVTISTTKIYNWIRSVSERRELWIGEKYLNFWKICFCFFVVWHEGDAKTDFLILIMMILIDVLALSALYLKPFSPCIL